MVYTWSQNERESETTHSPQGKGVRAKLPSRSVPNALMLTKVQRQSWSCERGPPADNHTYDRADTDLLNVFRRKVSGTTEHQKTPLEPAILVKPNVYVTWIRA